MKKKLLISLLLGVFFLWLAVRNVTLDEVTRELKSIKWIYIFPSLLVGIISHFFRALRWQVVLKNIKQVGLWRLFSINAVGFLFIHLFPFRLGEIAKPYLLKKREGISFSSGLATVAIERVFDGLTLVFLLTLGFTFASFKTKIVPHVGLSIDYLVVAGILFFGAAFIFLLLLVFSEKIAVKTITKISKVLPKKLGDRTVGITQTFVLGLSSLPSLRKNALILFYSLPLWLCSALIIYLGFLAFDLRLPWEACFVVLGITSLGIMLPAPPGFIGNFQLFCQGALGLYGISAATGLSYSIIIHAINLTWVLFLGLVFLPHNFISYKTVAETKGMEDA